ncbi:hypothetical protein IPG41_04925 [Candidatus Peregrinibacteria bacterium]|nr:MAG: hypothetical protein IPG41_04925 [Candidatus Peregrinibacteria bacterium]
MANQLEDDANGGSRLEDLVGSIDQKEQKPGSLVVRNTEDSELDRGDLELNREDLEIELLLLREKQRKALVAAQSAGKDTEIKQEALPLEAEMKPFLARIKKINLQLFNPERLLALSPEELKKSLSLFLDVSDLTQCREQFMDTILNPFVAHIVPLLNSEMEDSKRAALLQTCALLDSTHSTIMADRRLPRPAIIFQPLKGILKSLKDSTSKP